MASSWSIKPSEFIEEVKTDLVRLQKTIALEMIGDITANSPIDTGNYMANNIVSLGAPDFTVNTALDIWGTATRLAAKSKLVGLKPFGIVYIQNNSPYGEKLEFGGYNGPTVKVTSGGFSRMSPKGVYGISFIGVSEKYR